jgi:dipeptidyl aminopeptidase/acylaminoacyl peptidase
LLRDGTRGAQFCVMVDLERDEHHPLMPYPGIGSTDIGLLRRSPRGESEPMIAYLVTDAGRPRRELIAQPVGPDGRRGDAGVLAQRDDAELELLDSDENGALLVLGWNVAGGSAVELLDTATGARRPVPVLPSAVVSGCALSRDGSRLVLCLESPERPRGLWMTDTAEAQPAPEPAVALRVHPVRRLVEPTLETFVAHDGLALSGWLYRVPGREEPGPAMLSFHGGPEAQERPGFSPQHQAMVAAGIAVFAPNVRGSSGFGRAFVHADDRYGRSDAIADAASSAKFLYAAGIAEPGRLAVTGRSYGGFLTLAALAFYPELFAAGVDICGMSDLLTFYRDTEPWIAAAAVSKYGDPVKDRTLLRGLSPLRHAERIVAPLLVVHGELDTNVPIGEAKQIVAALRALGGDVEYLQLDGEGHEYRRASSRLLLIERMTAFLQDRLRLRART